MTTLSAGQLEKLRAPQHSSEMFLAVLVPEDAMTATVDGYQVRGETDIPYAGDTGEGNVGDGMLAYFGSTAGGKEIGAARVKSIDTGANTLTIEENDLELDSGNYITVKKTYLPRAKLPSLDDSGANVVFYKDGVAYSDQNLHLPPVVVMGPPACVFLEAQNYPVDPATPGAPYLALDPSMNEYAFADWPDGITIQVRNHPSGPTYRLYWDDGCGSGDVYMDTEFGTTSVCSADVPMPPAFPYLDTCAPLSDGPYTCTLKTKKFVGSTWIEVASLSITLRVGDFDPAAVVYFVDEYSWSPVSAALSTKTWGWDGGTKRTGSGTVASPYVVTFPAAGVYWVSLTITDANGKTSIGRRPVFVFDDDDPYIDFGSSARQLSLRGAQQRFDVSGDADQDAFPDDTWVVRFNRERFNGELYDLRGYRYPYRENVVFAGFLVYESVETNTDVFSTSFDVIDITRILDQLPGFGQILVDAASPADWTQVANLDVIKTVYYLLKWHSNVLELSDFTYSLARLASEIKVREQRIGKASLFRQCEYALGQKGIFATLCATPQGCLHIRQDPAMINPADRAAAVDLVAHLLDADWSELSIEIQERPRTQYVRLSGIAYDGSDADAYISLAPGVPEQAVEPEEFEGQVLIDQAETNQLAGDYWAKQNNPLRARITLPGLWDVFAPALQERLSFALAADQNNRGLVFGSSDYWLPREVTVDEDAHTGAVTVTVIADFETTGVPGIAITAAGAPTPPAPRDDPTPEPIPQPQTYIYPGVIVGTEANGVWYAEVLNGGSTNWEALGTGLSGDALAITDLLIVQRSGQPYVYAATQDGIYEYAGLPTKTNAWEKVWSLSGSVPEMLYLHASITNPGWVYWTWRQTYNPKELDVGWTPNWFADVYADVAIESDVLSSIAYRCIGNVWSVPNAPRTVYVAGSRYASLVDGSTSRIVKCVIAADSSGFDSVTAVDVTADDAGKANQCWCYVPYENANYVYWGRDAGFGVYEAIRRSTNAGSSFADVDTATQLRKIFGLATDEERLYIQTVDSLADLSIGNGVIDFYIYGSGQRAARVLTRNANGSLKTCLAAGRWILPYTDTIVHSDSSTDTDVGGDLDFGDNITAIARYDYEGLYG